MIDVANGSFVWALSKSINLGHRKLAQSRRAFFVCDASTVSWTGIGREEEKGEHRAVVSRPNPLTRQTQPSLSSSGSTRP